jgi:predicted dienelactone hydrolase
MYADASGPYKADFVRYDWVDTHRDRDVPVKIYYPADCNTPCPLIIFSHGLGGSREGYEYLGQRWASWGYVSVHVQHKGSDSEVWENTGPGSMAALKKASADPANFIDRPKDISFAIDQMEKLNYASGLFKGRLNLDHIGVAGHSFGAYTALAVAGQVVGGRLFQKSFADPRVKAVIAMSAPVFGRQPLDKAYGKIKIPVMHMTGTLDDSPIGETKAKQRRLPFDYIKAGDQYLITFNGGDHMVFSGRARPAGVQSKDERFHSLILVSTTAFWDAYLKGKPQAKTWLKNGGMRNLMGQDAVVEMK